MSQDDRDKLLEGLKAKSQEEVPGELHPAYRPAERDSVLFVRFLGNTPTPVDFLYEDITPFQLLSVSKFLEHKALQMIDLQERRVMQEQMSQQPQIAVPTTVIDPTKLKKG
jgi:hypothetical protein